MLDEWPLSVEEIIYSRAVGIDSDSAALRQWSGVQNHRKRLAELRATLRQEVAREIRNNLRRDIRRELTAKLRVVKGEANIGTCSFGTVPLLTNIAWAAAAGEHGREVFCDNDAECPASTPDSSSAVGTT